MLGNTPTKYGLNMVQYFHFRIMKFRLIMSTHPQTNIAMENHNFKCVNPLFLRAILNSYVKLPEDKYENHGQSHLVPAQLILHIDIIEIMEVLRS